MRKEKAKKHYLGKDGHEKLNCAQAIIKAFAELFDSSSAEVAYFAAFGGGRAPEGRCGALHAARHLIAKTDPNKADIFDQQFISAAGSIKCGEIRKQRKLTCLGCIEKAADLLKEARDDR